MSTGKPRKPRGTHTPEKRDEAMGLLVAGHTVANVARTLRVNEGTVRTWRDSPEGQNALAEARAARAAEIANAVGRARQLLEDNAVRAAQALVDGLDSKAPSVRTASARTLLDRVGVPVVKEVKATLDKGGADVSRLSTDELLELDRLNRKLRGEA